MTYSTQKHPEDESKYLILDHGAEKAQVVTLPDHWLYVRMTERAEQLDGIYLPDKSRDEHNTLYEVIAIGENVHKMRPRQRKFTGVPEMDRNACLDVAVGDTVIIPEQATSEAGGYVSFVKSSPVSRYEGLIDSGLVLAKVS